MEPTNDGFIHISHITHTHIYIYICIYVYIYLLIYIYMIYIPEPSKGSEILAPLFFTTKNQTWQTCNLTPLESMTQTPRLAAATRNSREAQHGRKQTPKRFFLSWENVSGRGDPQAFKSFATEMDVFKKSEKRIQSYWDGIPVLPIRSKCDAKLLLLKS